MLVNLIDDQHLQENKRAFQWIDTDHSGTVSQQEIFEAISTINDYFPDIGLTVADCKEFFSKFGLGPDEDISYSQFLAATLTKEQLTEDNIHQLFNYLNIFENGLISKDTLVKTF